MRIWGQLHDVLRRQGPGAVMVTVLDTVGSSPCNPGTRMIVSAGGEQIGTIGGGMLEWQAADEARGALEGKHADRCWKVDKLLGPDLAQCCGGGVTLLFENFSTTDLPEVERLAAAEDAGAFATECTIDERGWITRRICDPTVGTGTDQPVLEIVHPDKFKERFSRAGAPLLLFGAGHVGKALIRALAPLPFAVTWVDSRPGIFPDVLPPNTTALRPAKPPEILSHAAADSLVVVMTHSHALDLELVVAALGRPTFRYVGLIGSKSKCARFRNRLREHGLSEDAVERLICPIGVQGIGGKDAAVIAASVTAQLLAHLHL